MYWITIKHLSPEAFKRKVGVKRPTFDQMVKSIKHDIKANRKYPKRCRPPKLRIEDQVLLTLMYWREYRTMFHIAVDYGLSEATVHRIIRKTENRLIKEFRLPGKKVLQSENTFEVVVVDVSEHSIERPKKSSDGITQGRRENIP